MRALVQGWPLLVGLSACLAVLGCHAQEGNPVSPSPQPMESPATAPGSGGFSAYYRPVPVQVTPQAPGYALPLDLGQVANQAAVERLSAGQKAHLQKNGFVLLAATRGDDLVRFYGSVADREDPVYVTPDAVLHIFHIQFNETLKTLEEEKLIPLLRSLTERLQAVAEKQYQELDGDLQQAAQRNLAYLSVARTLLDPQSQPPAAVLNLVQQEVRLIEAHAGFSDSPLFTYQEDYSQYLPRGHYTRSEPLKAYFKAMMWYGRMSFLLKGKDLSASALVTAEEARRQTLQAALLAASLYGLGPAGQSLAEDWQRLYLVTAFFAGLADDLTPPQYANAIKQVAGASFTWAQLAEPATLTALRDKLAALAAPRIYGGTGAVTVMPPFSPEQLDKLLADTQGMRFMGQRYTPDSYIFQQLIFPAVEGFTGTGKPFTMEQTQGGPQRVFARGLDVMAVLGSDRALEQLTAEGDTAYQHYDTQLTALRQQFSAMSPPEWGRDLYTGWIYSLQALIQPRSEGYPNFMRTVAWENRQLQAALASWAQLRHDTILYAKQPYPAIAGAAPPPAPPEVTSPGYVEPVPEFYARMLALTNAMAEGLADMGLRSETVAQRLRALSDLLHDLLGISTAELSAKALTEEQEQTIKYFSSRLNEGLHDVDPEGLKTTVVADVLTDPNTSQALEEGSGYLREIVVAYSDAAGHLFLGRGATLSYYEFKQPMQERLTDEAWRQLLAGNKAPAPPAWVAALVAN